MAKAKKFKYMVTFEVTSEQEIKVKDLKAAVSYEVAYISENFEGTKVGKVSIVAAE